MFYIFICDKENDGCGHSYELSMTVNDYKNHKPKCPKCKKQKPVRRDWSQGNITSFMRNRTIGTIADNNTSRMSNDELEHRKSQLPTNKSVKDRQKKLKEHKEKVEYARRKK